MTKWHLMCKLEIQFLRGTHFSLSFEMENLWFRLCFDVNPICDFLENTFPKYYVKMKSRGTRAFLRGRAHERRCTDVGATGLRSNKFSWRYCRCCSSTQRVRYAMFPVLCWINNLQFQAWYCFLFGALTLTHSQEFKIVQRAAILYFHICSKYDIWDFHATWFVDSQDIVRSRWNVATHACVFKTHTKFP